MPTESARPFPPSRHISVSTTGLSHFCLRPLVQFPGFWQSGHILKCLQRIPKISRSWDWRWQIAKSVKISLNTGEENTRELDGIKASLAISAQISNWPMPPHVRPPFVHPFVSFLSLPYPPSSSDVSARKWQKVPLWTEAIWKGKLMAWKSD